MDVKLTSILSARLNKISLNDARERKKKRVIESYFRGLSLYGI